MFEIVYKNQSCNDNIEKIIHCENLTEFLFSCICMFQIDVYDNDLEIIRIDIKRD